MTNITTETSTKTVAAVEEYLALVDAEDLEGARSYLVAFFGEGEEMKTEELLAFSEEVRTAIESQETKEVITDDTVTTDVKVQEANTDIEATVEG